MPSNIKQLWLPRLCCHNYNIRNHCVDFSPRQMRVHQNNTFIFIMKALQGYGVNANAQETTLKKDRKYFMPYRPTQNDPNVFTSSRYT